ncbi:hypothetical protein WDU94_005914 [Cyamophila willieti]
MYFHVCLKMNFLCRPINTKMTFKWFLTNMSTRMINNVSSLISAVVASETCKFEFVRIWSVY